MYFRVVVAPNVLGISCKFPWHLGHGTCLRREACCLQRSFAFGVGEGKVVKGFMGIIVHASSAFEGCLRRRFCEYKVP